MKIIKTNFKDLIIVKNISYRDNRGYFKELMKENNFKIKFPFIVMSYSKKNVVRGLHLQTKEAQGPHPPTSGLSKEIIFRIQHGLL